MENSLTIIKKPQCLPFYPITALSADVLELMQRSLDASLSSGIRQKMGNLIPVFNVYCHVTATEVTYLSLSSPGFATAIQGFLGAMDDNSLIPLSRGPRREYQRSFVKLVGKMRDEIPMLPELTRQDLQPNVYQHVWKELLRNLDPLALRYWNGWEVQGRNGNSGYLPLAYVWNSHGSEFAELIYDLYRKDASKKLSPSHSDFNTFLYYLSDNKDSWPVSTFQSPVKIKQLFVDFMFHNFLQAVENGTDINIRTRSYSKFIYSMDEVFLQSGVWARPFSGSLPKPSARSAPGTITNTKKKADGTEVKVKLITEVPLHLTDSRAIEILFNDIQQDNALVLKWAKYRLAKAKEAYEICLARGKSGTVITGCNQSANKIDQLGAENICATFLENGTTHLKDNSEKIFGKVSRSQIFNLLGIPTVDTIFALQMLLTHAHPALTDGFFLNLELYNKKGNLSGFKKTESGAYQLTGYKDRSQAPNSERKIILSDEEAEWVKLIISMTKVLRNDLRKAGNDEWRYMFLHTGGRIVTPSRPKSIKLNNKTIRFQRRMVEEFNALGNRGEAATKRFVTQLSVTAFRASAAVEIFLRDHDVEEMARALGHKGYTSTLLSSYLPDPILAFFQTRWIRLFQRGIICRAMQDSPRLLDVARFADMEELHEFLKNHALRDIPEHLQNPDYLKSPAPLAAANESDGDKADQVVVSIDTGILTALLSLNAAVIKATNNASEIQHPQQARQLCSKAIYWSRFSDLVVKEIQDGLDSEMQQYLKVAQQHIDASHMEDLIYATAS